MISLLKLVIFDLDDTLYDYAVCDQIAQTQLLSAAAQRFSIPVSEAEALLTAAKKQVKNRLGDVAASHNRLLYMQALCEQAGVSAPRHALELYNIYWDTMLREMKLFPYVRPLFDLLHRHGVSVAILTDLTAHIQYRKLQALGIAEDIDFITTSEEAGREKPDPVMFETLLAKTPYSAAEVLMLGDSQRKDVLGAQAVGIQAIRFCKDVDPTPEILASLQTR